MLNSIRKYATSFVVKLLFVVLTLSFVIWGVADVFRPGQGTTWAAKVNGETISIAEFRQEYQSILRRIGAQVGSPLTDEQARAMGLANSVLNRMIESRLFDQAASDLGLLASDEVVREAIRNDPRFRNELKQFDANVFRETLRRNDFTEDRYVALLREELIRTQLLGSLAAGSVPPLAMFETLQRYLGERRIAEWVSIAADKVTGIAAPDEATLRQFHTDQRAQFTAPEFRSVTVIDLSADSLASRFSPSDADVEAAYAERKADFVEPERRSFQQLVFDDEAAARQAFAKLEQGADPAHLGDAGKPAPGIVTIGPVSRDQLPTELASAVFAAIADRWSGPVQSPIGWHVLKVTATEPEKARSLAEVRDQLRADLQRESAVNALSDVGNKLDDVLARGTPLEQAASELDLKVRSIGPFDSLGRDPSGQPVEGLPAKLAETAFATPEGSDSTLTEATADHYFVLRTDKVTASTLKPFEEVRGEVEAAWLDRQRREKAGEIASGLVESSKQGGDLAGAAKAIGLQAMTSPPFTRQGEGAPAALPPHAVATAFDTPVGEAVTVPADTGVVVLRVKEVLAATPDSGRQNEAELREDLAGAVRNDMIIQFAQALQRQGTVQINPRALEQGS